jgi:F-type H+-transporting ATPase subunit delta
MTLSAVADRYANALADVVTAGTSTLPPQKASAELGSFEAAVRSSPELHNALATPAVASSRKKAVVGRIAEILGLSRISRNFLLVLIDHRRIALLAAILETFDRVIDERLGYARAEVSSATRLTEEQRVVLNAQLERVTGKRIRIRYEVAPELIGGALARIGSTVYDGSVRGQLAQLQRRLSAEG